MKRQSIHKAVVGAIGGLLTVIGTLTGNEVGLPPEAVGGIGWAITSILIWLVPNKEKSP